MDWLVEEAVRAEENSRGHNWIKDKNGLPDMFGLDVNNHNGPRCEACGYSYCHHCQEGPDEECPNVIDVHPVRRAPSALPSP